MGLACGRNGLGWQPAVFWGATLHELTAAIEGSQAPGNARRQDFAEFRDELEQAGVA